MRRRAAFATGDVVRLYNASRRVPRRRRAERGRCDPASCNCRPEPGTIPEDPAAEAPLCVHGNPNVLTRDVGTSRLAQGCTGQLTVVEIERFERLLPPIKCFDPPSATFE